MTLIVGLRCADGSVLMCADRERSDVIGKRSVDKIFRILTLQGTFLVAGAGRASIIDNVLMRLDKTLKTAGADPNVVLFDKHKDLIETVLYEVYQQYIWEKREDSCALKLIIAASFTTPQSIPLLYATDEEIVYPTQLYSCAGNGEDLAYYFIDKLYNDNLPREVAAMLAALVFREVSRSVSGVGLGTDIQLLRKDQGWTRLPHNFTQMLESLIPEVGDTIAEAWNSKVQAPPWLVNLFT